MTKTGVIIFILLMAVALALDFWDLGDARHIPSTLRILAFGLLVLFLSSENAFGSKKALAQNVESIGTRNPRLARIACVIGLLVGGVLIVFSVLHMLHKL